MDGFYAALIVLSVRRENSICRWLLHQRLLQRLHQLSYLQLSHEQNCCCQQLAISAQQSGTKTGSWTTSGSRGCSLCCARRRKRCDRAVCCSAEQQRLGRSCDHRPTSSAAFHSEPAKTKQLTLSTEHVEASDACKPHQDDNAVPVRSEQCVIVGRGDQLRLAITRGLDRPALVGDVHADRHERLARRRSQRRVR